MKKYLTQIQDYLNNNTEMDSESVLAMLCILYVTDENNHDENKLLLAVAQNIADGIINQKYWDGNDANSIRRFIYAELNRIDVTQISSQSEFAVLLHTFLSIYPDYSEFLRPELIRSVSSHSQLYLFNYVENIIHIIRTNELREPTYTELLAMIHELEWYVDHLSSPSITFDRLDLFLGKKIIYEMHHDAERTHKLYNNQDYLMAFEKILVRANETVAIRLLKYLQEYPSNTMLTSAREQGLFIRHFEYSIKFLIPLITKINLLAASIALSRTVKVTPDSSVIYVVNTLLNQLCNNTPSEKIFLDALVKMINSLSWKFQQNLIDYFIKHGLNNSNLIVSNAVILVLSKLEVSYSKTQADLISKHLFKIMKINNNPLVHRLIFDDKNWGLLSKIGFILSEAQIFWIFHSIFARYTSFSDSRFKFIGNMTKHISNNNRVSYIRYFHPENRTDYNQFPSFAQYEINDSTTLYLLVNQNNLQITLDSECVLDWFLEVLKEEEIPNSAFEPIITALSDQLLEKLIDRTYKLSQDLFALRNPGMEVETQQETLISFLLHYVIKKIKNKNINENVEKIFSFCMLSIFKLNRGYILDLASTSISSADDEMLMLQLIIPFLNNENNDLNDFAQSKFDLICESLGKKINDQKETLPLEAGINTYVAMLSEFDKDDPYIQEIIMNAFLVFKLPIPEVCLPAFLERFFKVDYSFSTLTAIGELLDFSLVYKRALSMSHIEKVLGLFIKKYLSHFEYLSIQTLIYSFSDYLPAEIVNSLPAHIQIFQLIEVYLKKFIAVNAEMKPVIIDSVWAYLRFNNQPEINKILASILNDLIEFPKLLAITHDEYVYIGNRTEILQDWSIIPADHHFKLIKGFVLAQISPIEIKEDSLKFITSLIAKLAPASQEILFSLIIDLLKCENIQANNLSQFLQVLLLNMSVLTARQKVVLLEIAEKRQEVFGKNADKIIEIHCLQFSDQTAMRILKAHIDHARNLAKNCDSYFKLFSNQQKMATLCEFFKHADTNYTPTLKFACREALIKLSAKHPELFNDLINHSFLEFLNHQDDEIREFSRELLMNVRSVLSLPLKKTILNLALIPNDNTNEMLKLAYNIFDVNQQKLVRVYFVNAYLEHKNQNTVMSRALTKIVGYFYYDNQVSHVLNTLFVKNKAAEGINDLKRKVEEFLHVENEPPHVISQRFGF